MSELVAAWSAFPMADTPPVGGIPSCACSWLLCPGSTLAVCCARGSQLHATRATSATISTVLSGSILDWGLVVALQ
jgi:hypothetical protein